MICKLCPIMSNMKSCHLILSSSGYDSSPCLAYLHGICYPPVSCLWNFLGYQAHCHYTSVLVFQLSWFYISLASDSKSSVVKEDPGHSTRKGRQLWNCAAVLCNMWEKQNMVYLELRNEPQFQTSMDALEWNLLDDGDPWTYKIREIVFSYVFILKIVYSFSLGQTFVFWLVSCCK